MTTQVSNGNGAATAAPSRHTEAPASATVKAIDPTGYEWLLTVRGDSAGDMMTRVSFLVDWFGRNGWTPAPTRASSAPPAPNGQAAGQGNGQGNGEAAAICDTCGQPMTRKPRRDGTGYFWSCGTKYGNGQWCKGKPVK